MSNYICNIRCSYRQPSGYCGLTSGYETCLYRQLYSKQTNVPTPSDIRPIQSHIEHYELDMEKGTLSYRVIKTNADKIRSMTDEELAEFLGKVADGGYGMCAPGHYDCTGKDSCAPCWLDWLKQEVDDEQN